MFGHTLLSWQLTYLGCITYLQVTKSCSKSLWPCHALLSRAVPFDLMKQRDVERWNLNHQREASSDHLCHEHPWQYHFGASVSAFFQGPALFVVKLWVGVIAKRATTGVVDAWRRYKAWKFQMARLHTAIKRWRETLHARHARLIFMLLCLETAGTGPACHESFHGSMIDVCVLNVYLCWGWRFLWSAGSWRVQEDCFCGFWRLGLQGSLWLP